MLKYIVHCVLKYIVHIILYFVVLHTYEGFWLCLHTCSNEVWCVQSIVPYNCMLLGTFLYLLLHTLYAVYGVLYSYTHSANLGVSHRTQQRAGLVVSYISKYFEVTCHVE